MNHYTRAALAILALVGLGGAAAQPAQPTGQPTPPPAPALNLPPWERLAKLGPDVLDPRLRGS